MTNIEIIENLKILEGITEDLNTYQAWKYKGRKVKKGEKAITKTKLWKRIEKENKEGKKEKKFYLVNSALFTLSQTEPL